MTYGLACRLKQSRMHLQQPEEAPASINGQRCLHAE